MKKLIMQSIGAALLAIVAPLSAHKVGLCIVATGRYDTYACDLIKSARRYFCTDHEVTYFVFTDGRVTAARDTVVVHQKRLGWPHDTLMRCAIYLKNAHVLRDMDYVYALDADMLFAAPVGSEILSDRVATQHPGYVGRRGTYETDKKSAAYVAPHEGAHYFAGGFYGGSLDSFLAINQAMINGIERDLAKEYIAVWHDESHLNRCMIDHPPTLILSPAYCYPERWKLPYEKKLLALDKNHEQMRER